MVRIKTFPSMETKCAGTLITLQHVLTTSDCICGTAQRTKIMVGTDEEPGCRSSIHDVAQFIPYDGDYRTSSHVGIIVVSFLIRLFFRLISAFRSAISSCVISVLPFSLAKNSHLYKMNIVLPLSRNYILQ